MRLLSFSFVPGLLVLSACVGSATGDPEGSGGSGAETSEDGSGSGEVCERFEDAEPGSVEITIRNDKSVPIYLGQRSVTCSQTSYFSVQNADGLFVSSGGGFCGATCDVVRAGASPGCPLICVYPAALFLAPGEATRLGWDARSFSLENLPAACAPEASDVVACPVARRVLAGSLTFVVPAGSAPDCSETTGECGICESSPNGGCVSPATVVTGESYSAQTTVDFDPATTSAIEIAFVD